MHSPPGGSRSDSDRRRGHHPLANFASLLAVLSAVASCATPRTQYSADDLAAGVEAAVVDPDGAVEEAWVFLAPDTEQFRDQQPTLMDGRVAILRDVPVPGTEDPQRTFDTVLVYRTGPYCGHLPDVAVSVADGELHVAIASIDTGACDAMEYDEALGLRLSQQARGMEVVATHEVATAGD